MQLQEQAVRNLVGGIWKESASGLTFDDLSPADTGMIGVSQLSNRDDVREAFESARESFAVWAGTSSVERGKILFKAAEMIQTDVDRLSRILTREEGKTLA